MNNEEKSQLTLSYELLYLIQWLVEKEPQQLKSIINNALDAGLKETFKTRSFSEQSENETMHYSIADFLGLLEVLLHESINEKTIKQVMEKKLMPAIDHIDNTECDKNIVQSSVKKASSDFEQNPKNNPQELLFQEILKRWNPTKKTSN